jgi:pseudaminic acid cytidylyltransferase
VRAVCVIPARGGSKRLPRKNVIDFFGKPMIAYSIEAALRSERFERVIVSSEDREILDIGTKFGAEVVERAASLATDTARVSDVVLEFVDRAEAKDEGFDVIACLFAAAPMRTFEDVRAVVDLINPGICDFAIAVTEYDLPPHQALKLEPDKSLRPMWPELVNMRDEEVGPLVVDNGSTYAATVPAFRRQKNFYGSPLRGHLMARDRSVDMNSAVDLEIAKVHFSHFRG